MKYAVFDIESENWIRIRALGFFDGKEYREFAPAYNVKDGEKIVNQFLDHVNDKKYKGYRILAHNGGRFDFLFILEAMFRRKWHLRFIERGGRIVAIYVKTRKTEFHFADSYALLTASLKELGRVFDVPHPKAEFDFEAGKRVRVTRQLLDYLKNDCYCLYEVYESFSKNEWIERPQLTIASQSLNTFREKFQDGELYRIDLPYEELFRQSFYSGGRVEVYKGRGKVTCFDVNSLYPYAMLQEMPCGEMKQTSRFHADKIGFYKVEIKNTPSWYISPLLHKVQESGEKYKNFYVNGKGEYFLSSAMLNFLKSEFAIRFNVQFGFVFPKREHLFVPYVQTFYKLKQEHKGKHICNGKEMDQSCAMYFIAKFMLNSLYGKLGQSRFRESPVTYHKGMKQEFRTDEILTTQFGLVFVRNDSRSKFVLPYLASYITELARLRHFEIMNENPESIYYCDTDSLYTDSPKSFKKFVGSEIGQLSNEGTYDGIFLAPKCYALKNGEEKIRFKGFNTDQFSFSDFEKALLKGKVLSESRQRMLSFREAMRYDKQKSKRKIEDDRGAFLKIVTMKKQVESSYDRRRIIPGGRKIFDTEPFTFEEVQS